MNENLLSVADLCQELGISKSTAYKLLKTNQIKHGKIGSHLFVHKKELKKYIDSVICQK
jgi:excisionase family DNA binding protein